MTTYDDDERSVSGSRPIDLYTITTPTVPYLLTSHIVDVAYGGNTYAATTMDRGAQEVSQDLTGREMSIHLPVKHPLVIRFAASGIPEHAVVVTMHRLQATSGIAIPQWSAYATSIAIDLRMAEIRLPSIVDDAMKLKIPTVAAQRLCNHVLYDAQCGVDRGTATGSPETITAITGNGRLVATTSTGSGTIFVFGEIVHVVTRQRRMVTTQAGNVLTLDVPFVGVVVGDSVSITPGCDHSVDTCYSKFANVVNFGGHPNLNGHINPFAPGTQGYVVPG